MSYKYGKRTRKFGGRFYFYFNLVHRNFSWAFSDQGGKVHEVNPMWSTNP